jgi:DNA-binding IclR family transcriptional regulator
MQRESGAPWDVHAIAAAVFQADDAAAALAVSLTAA